MLRLDYAALPGSLLLELERAGKRQGLPLDTLEGLGQSEALARAFVEAARRGDRARMNEVAALAAAPGPRSAVHASASAA